MFGWDLRLLNGYTSILMSLFFHWKQPEQSVFWLMGLYGLNVILFYMLLMSKKKDFKVHYILGKSHHQQLRDLFLIHCYWQLLPIVIGELVLLFIFPIDLWRILGIQLIVFSAVLIKCGILLRVLIKL